MLMVGALDTLTTSLSDAEAQDGAALVSFIKESLRASGSQPGRPGLDDPRRHRIHTQREGAVTTAYQALRLTAMRLEAANLATANYCIFEAETAVSKIGALLAALRVPPQEVESALEAYRQDPQSWTQLLRS